MRTTHDKATKTGRVFKMGPIMIFHFKLLGSKNKEKLSLSVSFTGFPRKKPVNKKVEFFFLLLGPKSHFG